MAMMPRDVPISRADVENWHRLWKRTPQGLSWEDYVLMKITALDLEDEMVYTVGHENYGEEMHVSDMIMADMTSYGYNPDGSPV
jgi:hypothetical protein